MPLKSVTLEKLERMQKEVSVFKYHCPILQCLMAVLLIQAQEQLKLQESRTDSEDTETSQQ